MKAGPAVSFAWIAVLLVHTAIPATAETPAAIQDLLDRAAADCAGFENGTLHIGKDALARIDLGTAEPGWALDTLHLSCSSAASLFCGTGGCTVRFAAGPHSTDVLSKGWAVVDFGDRRVVVSQVHGANCGGTNLNFCALAVTLDDEGFQSVAP